MSKQRIFEADEAPDNYGMSDAVAWAVGADHGYAEAIKATESELTALREKCEELERQLDEAAKQEPYQPNYERMFNAAVMALEEISEYVGADPDAGGAAPIIEKLKEWKDQTEVGEVIEGADGWPWVRISYYCPVGETPLAVGAKVYAFPPNLPALIEQAKAEERERLGKLIHYPECWDTACYRTLEDALTEIGCNPDCCMRGAK